MWGNVCEPVMQSTHIDGGCGRNMLQMSARFANIAGTTQSHPTDTLSMDAFYPCPLIIQLGKFLGLFSLPSCFESFIRFTPSNRQGSSPWLSTLRPHWTSVHRWCTRT